MRPANSGQRRAFRQGTRIHITVGHMWHAPAEQAVLIIDNKTGNVTPISVPAAYNIANQLVDLAEQLERGTA